MVKVSSRDILDILRRFELADDDNIPRNIESLKMSHPRPINTLATFKYNHRKLFVLFDDTAEDSPSYVINQIHDKSTHLNGELVKNPRDDMLEYAMKFKGKECYLFVAISDKKRLDGELAKRYPELSRSTWQKHIKAGHVSVNGKVADSVKYEVADTDDIAVSLPDAPDFSGDSLPIIYVDDNVIVIDKPVGVLTHAKGAINEEFTVAEFFRRYTTYNLDTNRPGIVHRLDRDTSGLIIGARNEEAANLLQKQFADRKTKKTYYAVLDGHPKLDKANIDLPIERNPSSPSTFRVGSNGKNALTRYEVLASNERYSLVKLQPTTGRTHQLRVHMKYLGTPILGDRVYGKSADRLYLHAAELEVTIPGGKREVFKSTVPKEFVGLFPDEKISL